MRRADAREVPAPANGPSLLGRSHPAHRRASTTSNAGSAHGRPSPRRSGRQSRRYRSLRERRLPAARGARAAGRRAEDFEEWKAIVCTAPKAILPHLQSARPRRACPLGRASTDVLEPARAQRRPLGGAVLARFRRERPSRMHAVVTLQLGRVVDRRTSTGRWRSDFTGTRSRAHAQPAPCGRAQMEPSTVQGGVGRRPRRRRAPRVRGRAMCD